MNDHVHPLRAAYIDALRRSYKQVVRGDKNPSFTERAAKKIDNLGLTYQAYMAVAVRLCDGIAKFNGWAYPYYNVVVSDRTIDKVRKMMGYTQPANDNLDDTALYEYEMCYATSYIDWWRGKGDRPRREVDVPLRIQSQVAQAICNMYGIACVSSNYNLICQALDRKSHGH